jgi:hypothetical protein
MALHTRKHLEWELYPDGVEADAGSGRNSSMMDQWVEVSIVNVTERCIERAKITDTVPE